MFHPSGRFDATAMTSRDRNPSSDMKGIYTILLLLFSNVFMTIAWYGHLKFQHLKFFQKTGLFGVIIASWLIAFAEYLLMVPANRIGFASGWTGGQLKISLYFAGSQGDEPELVEYDFALCAAACLPEASQEALERTTDWFAWATFADDYFPLVYGRARDLAGGRLYATGLSAFMPLDCGATPPPRDPVECGLADLWRRTALPLSAPARAAFRAHVEQMLESWVWELLNHIENRVPDPVDYVEMRRLTFGAELQMGLVQLAVDPEVPAELWKTRTLRALINSGADALGMINDIVSYRKEVEIEGELNNGVLVVREFLDCPEQRAIEIVRDLATARIRQFEYVRATELPTLIEQFKLGAKGREAVQRYVAGLQSWIAGVAHWHLVVPRYTNLRVHPHPTAGGPVAGARLGLGSAGARVHPVREARSTEPTAAAGPGPSAMAPVPALTGLGTSAARLPSMLREGQLP